MRYPVIFLCLLPLGAAAQNVGINATGAAPAPSAMLDVASTTAGMLVPRMTAAQRTAIAAPATGLLVYQTDASGGIPANHFWFFDGTVWRPLFTDRTGWGLLGNAGTVATTNFLGTTDNVALRIRTNNTERFEFSTAGPLRAFANGTATAPAYSWTANTGTGMFQQAANVIGFSTNGTERFRIPNANQVHAVAGGTAALPFYSWSGDPNTGMWNAGADILAFSTGGAERMRMLANGQVAVNTVAPLAARQFTVQASSAPGAAIHAIGLGGDGVEAISTGTTGFGIWGTNTNAQGTGVVGAGSNQGSYFLVDGSGGAFTGLTTAVYAYYLTPGVGQAIYAADNFGANWRVGYWSGTNYYKIIGTGLVSTVVKDTEDRLVTMYCPEAPEILFQDYGVGQLENGYARIDLDPILSRNIIVNDEHPMKVFIQLEGECNGVYVTNKSQYGFDVRELGGGTSDVPFAWSIVATRGDEEFSLPDGTVRTATYRARFGPAPEPLKSTAR